MCRHSKIQLCSINMLVAQLYVAWLCSQAIIFGSFAIFVISCCTVTLSMTYLPIYIGLCAPDRILRSVKCIAHSVISCSTLRSTTRGKYYGAVSTIYRYLKQNRVCYRGIERSTFPGHDEQHFVASLRTGDMRRQTDLENWMQS